jgi:septum formation inhibitor MinC
VVELRESGKDRELALLVDVSAAGSSSRACQLIDDFVAKLAEYPAGALVDLNAGELLLTRGVLSKIKQQVSRAKATLGTVYSTVPQTQQAALDEGLYVKEKLISEWAPIRQPLPEAETPAKSHAATQPPAPKLSEAAPKPTQSTVDLPNFNPARKADDYTPVAPQSLDIPELAVPEIEARTEPLEEVIVQTSGEVTAPQEVEYPETAFDTLYLRQTLRSGQTVRFNGNVVIVGDVHAGSEVTAGGDILVWGELRGIAHAGAQGNFKSEIRAMKIEALQLRIADYIARRPDRIYYHKEQQEASLSPEAARVADGEIKIFKTMISRT